MFLATLDGRERHDMFGTLGERNLGFGAAQPRLREADFRIAPKGEQLLAPVEAIFEPSKLGAVGMDEQMKTLAVRQFVVSRPFGRVSGLEFLERHGVSPCEWRREP